MLKDIQNYRKIAQKGQIFNSGKFLRVLKLCARPINFPSLSPWKTVKKAQKRAILAIFAHVFFTTNDMLGLKIWPF